MRRHIIALTGFILITAVMTYPLVTRPADAIAGDYGDPLLNTWIISWDVKKMLELDPAGLYDTNIFHPHKRTLAYSENMLGNAVFALPVIVATGNPVLAYNILLFAGFALSGFAMYLLALYLTGSRAGAFVAGLVYAFLPWRFGQFGHLQTQMAMWLPLALLRLHRFYDDGAVRHILLFTLFFVLQFFACGYHALALALYAGLLMAMHIPDLLRDRSLAWKLAVFFAAAGAVIIPFYYPYIAVREEMGFSRTMTEIKVFSPDLTGYLAAPAVNRLWGEATRAFHKAEGELFLGLTAMTAALYALASTSPAATGLRRAVGRALGGRRLGPGAAALAAAAVLSLGVSFLIVKSGPIELDLALLKVRAGSPWKALLTAMLLLWAAVFLALPQRPHGETAPAGVKRAFYAVMLFSAVVFSLGPEITLMGRRLVTGPYMLLYEFFPGFDGLRVPARLVIMAGLALAVFTAAAVAAIAARLGGPARKAVPAVIGALVLVESASAPVLMSGIAVGSEIPAVYRWLADRDGDFAVMELPLPATQDELFKEVKPIYHSIYHWKRLVNGYSGYFPPAYEFLYKKWMTGFPDPLSVGLLSEELEVRYLIVHSGSYEQKQWERIRRGIEEGYADTLRLVRRFGADYVYEVACRGRRLDRSGEISREGWRARAGRGDYDPSLAFDGDLLTDWKTGYPQAPGDFFSLDLGRTHKVRAVELLTMTNKRDYPRGYRLETSEDGVNWRTAARRDLLVPPYRAMAAPATTPAATVISFEPAEARYVKIVLTGSHEYIQWSISELKVYE
ncbi:MAG TPA: hypothetical protein ENJ37_00415 [Deltaproteobacteria bacterium]|nr:hypothetical protein [Deltaproteobacteria bacterium]